MEYREVAKKEEPKLVAKKKWPALMFILINHKNGRIYFSWRTKKPR